MYPKKSNKKSPYESAKKFAKIILSLEDRNTKMCREGLRNDKKGYFESLLSIGGLQKILLIQDRQTSREGLQHLKKPIASHPLIESVQKVV